MDDKLWDNQVSEFFKTSYQKASEFVKTDIFKDQGKSLIQNIKDYSDNDNAWLALQRQYGDDLKISENAFRSYADTLDKEGRRGQASLKEFSKAQQKAMTTGKGFSDGLKSITKTTASILGNIAIDMAISKALEVASEAWNDYINRQEEAIERGEQAVSKYQENMEKISDASNLIKDSGERFESLQKGIENGVNISLTTDEYEEYLSLANQIADTFPELVAGYDSLGNPIIEASTSVEKLNEALREQQTLLAQETINSAQDIKDAFDAKVSYDATGKNEEAGLLQKRKALALLNSLEEENALKLLKGSDGVLANIAASWQDVVNTTTGFIDDIFGTNFEDSSYLKSNEKAKFSGEMAEALREIMEEVGIENASEIEIGTQEWENAITKLQDLKLQYTNELNSAFDDTKPLIEALFLGNNDYQALADNIKNAVSQVINGLNFKQASNLGFFGEDGSLDTDSIETWSSNVINGLNKSGIQDALEKLFTLDTKFDSLTFKNYQKEANKLIKTISSAVPDLSEDLLKEASGFNDAVEDIQGSYQKVFNEIGTNADKLSNEEIEIAAKIIGLEDFNGDYNDLMNKVHLAQSALDLDATPLKDAVDDAFESENAGDDYKDMISKGETAKELYDNGEIGTDDFKTFAAWLSPTGADDAMNFQENLGKFKRYFTEDSATGVHNFLKDLEAKNLAESTTAIDANGNAIEQWSYKIKDLEDAAQKMGIGFEPMMEIFGRLEDYGFSNNFVGSVEDGVDRIAEKSEQLAQAEAELAELTKPGQYETDAGKTFGNQTAIDAKREEVAQLKQDILETSDAMKQLVEHSAEDYKNEVEGAKVAIQTLQEERNKILSDESMDEDTRSSIAAMMQDQIDAWSQKYHLGIEGDAEITDSEYVGEEPVISATANITDVRGDFNIEGKEDVEQLGEYLSLIESGVKSDITLTVSDSDNLKETLTQIRELPEDSSANFNFNVSNVKDAELIRETFADINENRSEDNQITCTFNYVQSDDSPVGNIVVEGEVNTDSLTEQLNNLDVGATITYKADVEGVERDITAIKNPDGAILFTANVDGVEKTVQPVTNQDGTIDYYLGIQEEASDSEADVNYLLGKQASPIAESALVDYVLGNQESPKDKTAYVTYKVAGSLPTIASGAVRVDGTAHAVGTVPHIKLSKFNDGYLGTAHANGDWSLKKDETSLTGELGREIVVRNGKFFTVGNNGAEFVNLKRGDIIFNHRQSEELLSKGYVTSRGKLIGGNAYAGGSGGGTFGIGGSGSKSGITSIGSSSNKSTDANTSAVEENTEATEAASENLKDWAEIYVDRIIDSLSKFKDTIDRLEVARNQNASIDGYIKEATDAIGHLQSTANYYLQKANSLGLSSDYVNKIKNGQINIQDISDENLKEKIEKFQEWYEKAKDITDQIEDLNIEINELKVQKLDNLFDDYDNLVGFHKSLSGINDVYSELAEKMTGVGNLGNLLNNLNQNKQIKAYYEAEAKELQTMLDALVADGAIGLHSDTWLEWASNIAEVKQQIVECDMELWEMKDAIREVRLKDFTDSIENLEHANDVLSSIRDLMSEEGIFDRDTIAITDLGYAQLGIMSQELVNAKQQVANYNTATEALDKDLENGNITQNDYNELLKEYEKSQMDAVSAVKSYKDAIIDVIKNGIEKETEAMEELISKRKEDLDMQKEYYDFQKEMSDKSSEINRIKAQISAISGSDSLEDKQRLRSLQSQLKQLQDEYNETLKERQFDLVQDAYDKTSEQIQENKEDVLYELETDLEAQNKAIASVLQSVQDNYTSVYEELNILSKEYGYEMSESLTKPWEDAQNALNNYLESVGKINSNVSVNTDKIESNYNAATSASTVGSEAKINQQKATTTTTTTSNVNSYSAKASQIGQILQRGMVHSDVGILQSALKHMGYYNGNIDNDFGDQTYAALRQFQTDAKASGQYNDAIDGILGTNTKKALGLRGYYTGTTNAKSGWALLDDTKEGLLDFGSELVIADDGSIVTPYGRLKKLDGGEVILNKLQTQKLVDMVNSNFIQPTLPKLPEMKIEQRGGDVNIHYDNIIGKIDHVDKNVLPDLQTIIERSAQYTIKTLNKYSKR